MLSKKCIHAQNFAVHVDNVNDAVHDDYDDDDASTNDYDCDECYSDCDE